MNTNHESTAVAEPNLARAKHCLALIRDIAARGERSADPEHVGYALQELSQVLLERTGTQEIHFEPCPAGQIVGLGALQEELDWVDSSSQSLAASETGRSYGFTS
jgi:hypothetical protein